MFRQFTMILLAVAVLFGSTHAASWSHDHSDGDHHAVVVAHVDDHDTDHHSDFGQMVGQEEPSDTADVKGDVVSHHSHPFGVAAAAMPYGLSGATSGTLIAIAPARMLASFSQAPPTQPPSA
jgi:hypothetical protein